MQRLTKILLKWVETWQLSIRCRSWIRMIHDSVIPPLFWRIFLFSVLAVGKPELQNIYLEFLFHSGLSSTIYLEFDQVYKDMFTVYFLISQNIFQILFNSGNLYQ